MNFLGVGGSELLVILLVMLVIAGPKRMIHWSYLLGQHVAKFRRMWSETVDIVQKEFDDAGVGIQLPKDVPTRGSLNKQAGNLVSGVTAPVQETMKELNTELGGIQASTRDAAGTANSVARGSNGGQTVLHTINPAQPAAGATVPARPATGAGTSAGQAAASATTRRKAPGRADDDFGAWSSHEAAGIGVWSRTSLNPEEEA